VKPTQEQIDSLRTTLSELSLQAEESQQSELSDFHQVEDTISSWTTPEETGDLFGTGSGSSIASSQSFSSPLGFLRAALPEVSTAKLRKALQDAGKDDIDIWDIVAGILTEEYIQEMEERGLDGLDDEDNLPLESDDRETVEMRKKKTQPKNHKKKAQPRPQKIALADIRQQHHVLPKKNGLNTKDPPVSTDPWTQLSSLSEYVSSLIPRHPASYFQSFFHSPKYSTSYEALRAALTSLCKFTDEDHHVEVLYNLLDVIMPEYEDSDIVQRNRLISDVQLAVQVTDGSGYEALDLVNVLRDLDSNAELGIYHLQPKADSFAQSLPAKKIRLSPSGPPPVEPPPPKVRPQKSPVQSTPKNKPSPFQWQAVPERKLPPRGPHPLAHHIPAYTRDVNGTKTARAAGTRVAGGPGSSEFRRQMAETMRKRNEALKEASRMWQRGNSKTRGGEIAFYFAERVSYCRVLLFWTFHIYLLSRQGNFKNLLDRKH